MIDSRAGVRSPVDHCEVDRLILYAGLAGVDGIEGRISGLAPVVLGDSNLRFFPGGGL